MSQTVPGNGVYFVLPEKSMIEALDDLFSGKPPEKIKNEPQPQGQLDLW